MSFADTSDFIKQADNAHRPVQLFSFPPPSGRLIPKVSFLLCVCVCVGVVCGCVWCVGGCGCVVWVCGCVLKPHFLALLGDANLTLGSNEMTECGI
jgi:hypothetical protein